MLDIIATTKNGTNIYLHPECHPHRLDSVAKKAITFMVVPESPVDKENRAYTKIVDEHNFHKKIGWCHLVRIENRDNDYYDKRENREYDSHMVLQHPVPETKLTTVVIWDKENNCWVLLTNYEGEATNVPEPGCETFKAGTKEQQNKWYKFWYENGLVPKKNELEKHIKKRENDLREERDWLLSWEIGMPSLEFNARWREIERQECLIAKMRMFLKYHCVD